MLSDKQTAKTDDRVFMYRIDAEDKIINVNEEWLSFASENGTQFTNDLITKKTLWDFISDQETVHLYKIMLQKVRQKKKRLKVPFRCDSPSVRRFMVLEMFSPDGGSVDFSSHILKQEKRKSIKLLESNVERSNKTVRMCSWCKKMKVSETTWVEVEEAVQTLNLFELEKFPILTHTICPECKKGFV